MGIDYWSLGIVIYKFFFGFTPFGEWEDKNTVERIRKFQNTVLFSENVPEGNQHFYLTPVVIFNLKIK